MTTQSLVMQESGDLTLKNGNETVWSTSTSGSGARKAVMQNDGNFVLYEPNGPVWSSNSWQHGWSDRKLVPAKYGDEDTLRVGQFLAPGGLVTSKNERFTLIHQEDGNVAIYDWAKPHGSQAVWSCGTTGSTTRNLVMQESGDLTLKNGSEIIWSTSTSGSGARKAVMQNDGNFVLYEPNGPVWSSNSWQQGWSDRKFVSAKDDDKDTLKVGASLMPGESVTSKNKRFTLVHQEDGNVVIYDRAKPLRHQAVWACRSYEPPTQNAKLQDSGEVLILELEE